MLWNIDIFMASKAFKVPNPPLRTLISPPQVWSLEQSVSIQSIKASASLSTPSKHISAPAVEQ